MKKVFICIVALSCVAALCWLTNAQADQLDRGKSVYQSKCEMCHGANGDGRGPAAAALGAKPKDFRSPDFFQKVSDDKIANTIENGYGVMPALDLSSDDVRAVIEYLHHAFGG